MLAFAPPREVARAAWPLRSRLELGALPGAVPCARLHTRQVLWEWGIQRAVGDAQLVVSELVTNAIMATRELVHLWLLSDHARVVILVMDNSPVLPVRESPADDDPGGRGLMIVEALADDWGAYRASTGKVVWALLSEL